jgi:hypothetical protein
MQDSGEREDGRPRACRAEGAAEGPPAAEIVPLNLEELDQRLETSFLPLSNGDTLEPCVWNCSCFLVRGTESP